MELFFLGSCSTESRNDILDKKTYLVTLISNLIGIHFFQSFLINNIFKINHVSNKNNKYFVENQTIFNRLDDERNWISANFAKKLRSD